MTQAVDRAMWEYKVIDAYDYASLTAALDELGKQGWELVAVTGNNTHRAFFKRRLRVQAAGVG